MNVDLTSTMMKGTISVEIAPTLIKTVLHVIIVSQIPLGIVSRVTQVLPQETVGLVRVLLWRIAIQEIPPSLCSVMIVRWVIGGTTIDSDASYARLLLKVVSSAQKMDKRAILVWLLADYCFRTHVQRSARRLMRMTRQNVGSVLKILFIW